MSTLAFSGDKAEEVMKSKHVVANVKAVAVMVAEEGEMREGQCCGVSL